MIFNENCLDTMARMPADHVNLIMTSPPYADARKDQYGGVKPDEYVDWFLPISKELHRTLKPDGSFILNIKEKVVDGERSTYVYELVLALKKQGWMWVDDFIWHKPNPVPGKYPNRFRDAWEHVYHFSKSKKFKMNQEAVMVPISDALKKRMKNPTKTDKITLHRKTGSGVAVKATNWVGKTMGYPTNVLYLSVEAGEGRGHPAVYPLTIPTWFIKLFSDEGDLVYDPFTGSGTTGRASMELNRKFIGSEILEKYIKDAKEYARDGQTKLGGAQIA